jgi:hypothetical protein
MKYYDGLPLHDRLKNKIYAYYHTIWKDKWRSEVDQAEEWLDNFSIGDDGVIEKERINMLYLLSKFMYFGNEEIRQLLISLYRDLFKYPIIESIRKSNDNTTDVSFINNEFQKELEATRFLGVGNPSESGVHLLYYFRQECQLSKMSFINASDIFKTSQKTERVTGKVTRTYLKSEINDKSLRRYVFIDDFCGSGSQASIYLKRLIENMKFEAPDIKVSYLMLFGTEFGIGEVRKLGLFDIVEAVFTIDETFKAFSKESRYFNISPGENIEKDFSKNTSLKYGRLICNTPLGYRECQLLLGFYHNTPDNSLPIFWSEKGEWKPIFKRYHKIY